MKSYLTSHDGRDLIVAARTAHEAQTTATTKFGLKGSRSHEVKVSLIREQVREWGAVCSA